MDMAKIRSILKNPIGKPRTLFSRRKSTNDRVMFSSSIQDGDDGKDNGKKDDDKKDDGTKDDDKKYYGNKDNGKKGDENYLIDFSNEIGESSGTAHATDNLHQRKQSVQVSNNKSIFDEFDPVTLKLATPLIPSVIGASDANSVSSVNDVDVVQTQSRSTASKPVPDLIPIGMVSKHTSLKNMRSTSKQVLRRPLPGLIHFKLISREALQNALKVHETPENTLANDSLNNECIEINTDDEFFGKLRYDSDSDSN